MKLNIRKSAIKDLRRISEKDRDRIHRKILDLEVFPEVSNIKRLTNFDPAYRLRVGNYRVLFDVYEDIIEIARVLHRRESYK
jgi:mRNA interferase RelE/StbE